MQRRDFIKSVAMAISALPLYGSTFLNLPKRIAIIGTGWWGMNILNEAMAAGNCTIVGVCDVDENALNAAWQTVKKVKGDDPKKYKELLKYVRSVDKTIEVQRVVPNTASKRKTLLEINRMFSEMTIHDFSQRQEADMGATETASFVSE